ncbi:MAG: hypothetical protein ACK5MV_12975 [Aminipila sp.]
MEIQIEELDNGNVKWQIGEGDTIDELEYCTNGELLYNRENVMISDAGSENLIQ